METDMDYAEAEGGAVIPESNHKLMLEEQWHAKYQELIKYKEEHGDCIVPQKSKTHPSLAEWVHSQRKNYKKNILSQERIVLLEAIDFAWYPKQNYWEKMFKQLQDYKAEKGHCSVPTHIKEFSLLSSWIDRQRKKYQDGTLSEEQVRLLDEVGFSLDPYSERWNAKYQELVQFQLANGHCKVRWKEPYKNLYNWANDQRNKYKENSLDGDKVDLLLNLGFVFPTIQDANNITNPTATPNTGINFPTKRDASMGTSKAASKRGNEDDEGNVASQTTSDEGGSTDVNELLATCRRRLQQSRNDVNRLTEEIKSKDAEIRRLRATITALVE